jgi:hypothetical protein
MARTDAERLDWLTGNPDILFYLGGFGWSVGDRMTDHADPRTAIDAAMDAELAANATPLPNAVEVVDA